ncbi:hypothetical protein RJZ56_000880 [Blastomyces dermatitidis]
MAYPNCLDPTAYEGNVGGIRIEWHKNAVDRLSRDAREYQMDEALFKKMAEHLTHEGANRMQAKTVVILNASHATTTVDGKPEKHPDHLTVQLKDRTTPPNQLKSHIYLIGIDPAEADRDVNNIKVKGMGITYQKKIQ